MGCEMLKFVGLCLTSSKIQNLLSSWDLLRPFCAFFGFLRLKDKMKNNHLFTKKNYIVFSYIIQNNKPKSKKINKRGTKHPFVLFAQTFLTLLKFIKGALHDIQIMNQPRNHVLHSVLTFYNFNKFGYSYIIFDS